MEIPQNLIIVLIIYPIMLFLSAFILWYISKRQKLKRRDFKIALLIIGIPFVVSFVLSLPSYLGITFPMVVNILIGTFTLILTPFLIKRFYQIKWWKAIKIYLLMIVMSIFIMTILFFIVSQISFFIK